MVAAMQRSRGHDRREGARVVGGAVWRGGWRGGREIAHASEHLREGGSGGLQTFGIPNGLDDDVLHGVRVRDELPHGPTSMSCD